MLHFIVGEVKSVGSYSYIINDLFGLEVTYSGKKSKGEFYLFPYFDQTNNTYKYLAFDDFSSKGVFEKIYKIPGIGPKTAHLISSYNESDLIDAIENFDLKFFQSIPGIGPKTAKRLLVELKGTFSSDDLGKLNIDDKLYKDIIASLKGLGYQSSQVKKLLSTCPIELDKKNISSIIKWLIDNI